MRVRNLLQIKFEAVVAMAEAGAAELVLAKRFQRPLQDYCAWRNYLIHDQWCDMEAHPTLSQEIILQQMGKIGLILPNAATKASLTAGIMVASYGMVAPAMADSELDRCYGDVKKRIKQLYVSEPCAFVASLPASPAVFLKEFPGLARLVFSAEALPCSCPLPPLALSAVEGRVVKRGKAGNMLQGGWGNMHIMRKRGVDR